MLHSEETPSLYCLLGVGANGVPDSVGFSMKLAAGCEVRQHAKTRSSASELWVPYTISERLQTDLESMHAKRSDRRREVSLLLGKNPLVTPSGAASLTEQVGCMQWPFAYREHFPGFFGRGSSCQGWLNTRHAPSCAIHGRSAPRLKNRRMEKPARPRLSGSHRLASNWANIPEKNGDQNLRGEHNKFCPLCTTAPLRSCWLWQQHSYVSLYALLSFPSARCIHVEASMHEEAKAIT